jgi:hypothetical protein
MSTVCCKTHPPSISNILSINKSWRIPKRAITKGQSRETGNKNTNKTKQKHNTLCVGHHYTQTNTSFHFDVLSLIVDNFTA